VFGVLCKRSLLYSYVQHGSDLVNCVIRQAISLFCFHYVLRRNVLFCSRRYSFNIEDVSNGNINLAAFVYLCRNSRPTSDNITIGTALMFFIELIVIRDNVYHLSNVTFLTRDECTMIDIISTA